MMATSVKWYTGGSLEIGGATLTWGQGWLIQSGEVVNWNNAGSFYLAASGATATCMILEGFSPGNET